MNFITKIILAAFALLSLNACVTTNQTDIAPNVVRLDTEAGGVLFQGQAGPETLKKAAELTLSKGYRYFRYADVSTGQSNDLVGVYSSANANVYGGYQSATIYGSSTSSGIFRPSQRVGVTVIMSNEKQPGSWDAAEVLATK